MCIRDSIEVVLGVTVAIILNRAFVGRSLAKLLLLLPLVATPVAVGICLLYTSRCV